MNPNNRKLYILFAASSGLILLLVGLVLLFLRTGPSRQSDTTSTAPHALTVKKVVPDISTVLTPGKPLIVSFFFDNSIEHDNVTFSIAFTDIAVDSSPSPLQLTQRQVDNKTLEVKSVEDVRPRGRYDITAANKSGGQIVFSTHFLSGDISPTKVLSNNPALSSFLPHETNNYSLVYLPTRNVYVFRFKFDPSVPGTISSQFEKAKTDANTFIRSKGIDPASIVIEYRHS